MFPCSPQDKCKRVHGPLWSSLVVTPQPANHESTSYVCRPDVGCISSARPFWPFWPFWPQSSQSDRSSSDSALPWICESNHPDWFPQLPYDTSHCRGLHCHVYFSVMSSSCPESDVLLFLSFFGIFIVSLQPVSFSHNLPCFGICLDFTWGLSLRPRSRATIPVPSSMRLCSRSEMATIFPPWDLKCSRRRGTALPKDPSSRRVEPRSISGREI